MSAIVQFDLLKYLLSELHSGSRRLPIEFPEHLIIAGSLHHPANLPTVEHGDITTPISFYRGHAYFYTQL
jgi:hypothetical protein